MRALITGGGGQLGRDLAALLGPDSARAFSHAELDIGDEAAVERAFAEVEPDVVFNCAAFHNVEVCESERGRGLGDQRPRRPATSPARGAKLVHVSTNYVFDGRREEPYGEDDLPSPGVLVRDDQAGRRVRGARLRRGARWSCAPPASTASTAAPRKGGNFVQRMVGRAASRAS